MNTPATNPTVTTCLTQPSKVSRKWVCYVHRSVQLDLLVILLLVPTYVIKGDFYAWFDFCWHLELLLELLDILYIQMHNYKTRPKMTLIWCLQMTRPVIQRWQLFVECMQ